jgi:hypothetical protein
MFSTMKMKVPTMGDSITEARRIYVLVHASCFDRINKTYIFLCVCVCVF